MAGAFYRAVRETTRREVPLLAAGPTTALQAAKALADRLSAEHQLQYVIYRNGAWVPAQAWAESATLTMLAVAYNSGTLNRAREAGKVFDGAGGGWTSHQDPDKATGTLRTVEDAAAWPISHPRCGRAFGRRPD
ncbi:hypothetical protein ACFYWN_36830 [Streptomyces sp. NPDC002917]|uniref:hypothetical protein n=1 Tax=unclassified Streptomyces TaxID=2593676 RepID=UPI002E811D9D|nr:hypothetical protein [Streptomyces sp. NBC_00562]WTC76930.1 hypothetical protein OH719_02480 [Streptomyces sp. NBC_01653]WTD93930.1 hypothetical protein OG891_44380 [Streptomyces sp. NBC_01637]WUC24961.1 hypothetical protein OHA33_43060 [Streptomyces sp. NBC_00562]